MKEVFLMKYIIHILLQCLLVLGLTNVCLAFVPKTIRKTIAGTFKFAFMITKFIVTQLRIVVKTTYANYKEMNEPKKKKYSPCQENTNSDSKVIQFPKANSK
jgi:hypothetical protein